MNTKRKWNYDAEISVFQECERLYNSSHHGNFYNHGVIHRYISDDNLYCIEVESFGESLEEYLNRESILQKYQVDGYHRYVRSILHVPNFFRKMLRELIDFILYTHHSKCTISCLALDNLFVQDGIVLVVGHVLKTVNFKKQRDEFRRDFHSLAKILRSLFRRVKANQEDWPADAVCLLELMEDYDCRRHSHLLYNHLAILPSPERLMMFSSFRKREFCLSLGEKGKKGDIDLYADALKGMITREWYWPDQLAGNVILQGCFDVKKYYYDREIRFSDERSTTYNRNFALIDYCRNASVHIFEEFKNKVKLPISWLVSELMIMETFGAELVSFEEQLNEKGILYMFTLDNRDDLNLKTAPFHIKIYLGEREYIDEEKRLARGRETEKERTRKRDGEEDKEKRQERGRESEKERKRDGEEDKEKRRERGRETEKDRKRDGEEDKEKRRESGRETGKDKKRKRDGEEEEDKEKRQERRRK